MKNIVVIGSGNVAFHLLFMLKDFHDFQVRQIFVRDVTKLTFHPKSIEVITDYRQLCEADLYLLAVSDSAIENVSKNLSNRKGLVCHTSGSVSIEAIQHQNRGVFYPFQTFTKGQPLNYTETPICIEANSEENVLLLTKLAKQISNTIYFLNSEQRKHLHLAGVWVNNFVNHMYYIGYDIVKNQNISTKILLPLIQETAAKMLHIEPYVAQTGPAKRHDINIIQQQTDMIQDTINKEIYQIISKSILEIYDKTI